MDDDSDEDQWPFWLCSESRFRCPHRQRRRMDGDNGANLNSDKTTRFERSGFVTFRGLNLEWDSVLMDRVSR